MLPRPPWIAAFAALLACALGVLVWAQGRRSAEADPPAAEQCRPAAGDSQVAGALLHVPPHAVAPLPLVLAFHGAHGDGPRFAVESDLSDAADRYGFAVVYPTAGSSAHVWSPNHPPPPDHVAAT